MTSPDSTPLLDTLLQRQAERGLTNAEMAVECGVSEAYWKSLRVGRRPITLVFARQVYHRFTDAGDLVLRLLAKRFIDEWFAANPDAARAVGAD